MEHLLCLRLLDHPSEDAEDLFDELDVALLANIVDPKKIKKFRPIAVLSVLHKLYSMTVASITHLRSKPMDENQLALRATYQSLEVITILRQVVEKAIEFDRDVFIFDGDIWKAYDTVEHAVWAEARLAKGVPRIIVAAYIREVRRAGSRHILPKMKPTKQVRRQRSMYQGDPEAPNQFNIVIDHSVLDKFLVLARTMIWELKYNTKIWNFDERVLLQLFQEPDIALSVS